MIAAARQENPHAPGSLAFAAWLGGWTGYYGKPGPVVMPRLRAMMEGGRRAGGTVGGIVPPSASGCGFATELLNAPMEAQ